MHFFRITNIGASLNPEIRCKSHLKFDLVKGKDVAEQLKPNDSLRKTSPLPDPISYFWLSVRLTIQKITPDIRKPE